VKKIHTAKPVKGRKFPRVDHAANDTWTWLICKIKVCNKNVDPFSHFAVLSKEAKLNFCIQKREPTVTIHV
jgi:hypothetical protein